MRRERPIFPKRAIVTAGMPYGNKELHFGHIGGVFIHADTYARFLRDRIGKENVIFVSGTDCYGSPILTSYNMLIAENKYKGSIEDYVRTNYNSQKRVLEDYEINLDLYGASALDRSGVIHNEVSNEVFNKLYEDGYLEKKSSPQFYDIEADMFLNGRQVIGKCPIDNCQSDKGYADECSLGHQYMPNELIEPISIVSGKKPELRMIENWYFKLDEYMNLIKEQVTYLKDEKNTRKFILNTIEEFLKNPIIYIKRSEVNKLDFSSLPSHEIVDEAKKSSISIIFSSLDDRDKARTLLDKLNIRYRTGKTLVPLRLSGNIEWGVKVDDKENLSNRTFWVWPESLWAPISFTKTHLINKGLNGNEWTDWWDNKDSKVYQFIGEDNIYFYGIAEMGLFMSLRGINSSDSIDFNDINLPQIIANNHVLYMNKKASSSSNLKPPMADELLKYYTPEQLRMHFLSLNLSKKSSSFEPHAFMDEADKIGKDPVLKDGNLLTNVFNRFIRSCFYTSQKYYDSKIPVGDVSDEIKELIKNSVYDYEYFMYKHEFHRVIYVLDDLIRKMNKYWASNTKNIESNNDLKQVLVDSFYALRIITTLLHPIAPTSCEMVKEYLRIIDKIWDWDYILDYNENLIPNIDNHILKHLEPRVDFFKKHDSQYKKKDIK